MAVDDLGFLKIVVFGVNGHSKKTINRLI